MFCQCKILTTMHCTVYQACNPEWFQLTLIFAMQICWKSNEGKSDFEHDNIHNIATVLLSMAIVESTWSIGLECFHYVVLSCSYWCLCSLNCYTCNIVKRTSCVVWNLWLINYTFNLSSVVVTSYLNPLNMAGCLSSLLDRCM